MSLKFWKKETPNSKPKRTPELTPQNYEIDNHLSTNTVDGFVDKIEWSITYQTWCYRLGGKKPYWIYQTEPIFCRNFYLLKGGGSISAVCPIIPPDPVLILE